MGRLTTVALVGAVVLLGVAAAVDALRGGGEPAPTVGATTTSGAEDLPVLLREAGVGGVLYYTDASNCELRGFALPTLRHVEAPRWTSCGFALGPNGLPAAEGTVFAPDPERGLEAAEVSGGVDVFRRDDGFSFRLENARAPAFRPDASLTVVTNGRLVAFERCGPGARARFRAWPGRCRRTITTEDAVTDSLDPSRLRPVPERVALVRVVWLPDGTMLAVARARESDVLLQIQPTVGHPVVNPRFQAGRIYELALSPAGRYVAVLSGTGRVAVLDPLGRLVASPGLRVRAMSWSPDERWLAVLSGPGVAFVRPESPVTQIGPITLSARDVGWH
jgi:hypothetical protein